MVEIFEHSYDGTLYRGRIVRPAGAGLHPGVIVMHDGRGVTDFVCDRAEALAAMGYVAFASDMFGEGVQYPDPAEGTSKVIALRRQGTLMRARVRAVYEAFAAAEGVDAARIGAIGYCFGGQCVLELARSGADARAVASFHGTLSTHQLARPGEIKAQVLVLTGAQDPFAVPADRETFESEMVEAGAEWQMTVFGSGKHGFSDPISDEMASVIPGVGYSALIDRLSWKQAIEFLDAALRG
jgi:dienelactone hydrolase